MPLRFWTFSAQRRDHERSVQKNPGVQISYGTSQRSFRATLCGIFYSIGERASALSPIQVLGWMLCRG
jgi:hypothetical protein